MFKLNTNWLLTPKPVESCVRRLGAPLVEKPSRWFRQEKRCYKSNSRNTSVKKSQPVPWEARADDVLDCDTCRRQCWHEWRHVNHSPNKFTLAMQLFKNRFVFVLQNCFRSMHCLQCPYVILNVLWSVTFNVMSWEFVHTGSNSCHSSVYRSNKPVYHLGAFTW